MSPRIKELTRRSRDPKFLLKSVLAIVAISLLGAVVCETIRKKPARTSLDDALATLDEEDDEPKNVFRPGSTTAEEFAEGVRQYSRLLSDTGSEADPELVPRLQEQLEKSRLSQAEKETFAAFIHGLFLDGGIRDNAMKFLLERAELQPPPRFTNEFLGDLHWAKEEFNTSVDYFEKELKHHPQSAHSIHAATKLSLNLERTDVLERMRDYSIYEETINRDMRLRAAAMTKDIPLILEAIVESQIEMMGHPELIFLSAICGSVWFIILMQVGGISGRWLFFGGAAGLFGVLSVTLTLLIIYLQNSPEPDQRADMVTHAIYWIGLVGVREELCKLLLFLPLLPFLMRKGNECTAMVMASVVGLGFAIAENVQYFLMPTGIVAGARFVASNFFHLALTGLLGHAAFQMARNPKGMWQEFLSVLIGVIVIHGLYDFLLSYRIPGTGDTQFIAIVVLIVVAYRYFWQLRQIRTSSHTEFSPLAVFLFGITTILGLSLWLETWNAGLAVAFKGYLQAAIWMAPICFAFAYQFQQE